MPPAQNPWSSRIAAQNLKLVSLDLRMKRIRKQNTVLQFRNLPARRHPARSCSGGDPAMPAFQKEIFMAQEASEMAGWPCPKQGEFVWSEIAATDANTAQAFYENVFGWTFKHGDATPGMDYREFTTGGDRPVGGLYQIDPAWFGGNPPPAHWMIY